MTMPLSRRTTLRAAVAATASLVATGAVTSRARADRPTTAVAKIADTQLDPTALFFVSFDGLVNNASFQQNGLLTYRGYQYAAWWTADRSATIARRKLTATSKASPWEKLTLPHKLTVNDSHNVISMGVSQSDGRMHIAMDTHGTPLFYVKSESGLLDSPDSTSWTADRFGPVQRTLDGVPLTTQFTYPMFLVTPEGRLQLSYRSRGSGSGESTLAEYDGTSWTVLGNWSSAAGVYTSAHGSSNSRNLYQHGITYGPDGKLHVSYTWREGNSAVMCASGGLSNHDTGYVFSTDRGRTWRNAEGTVVAETGGALQLSVSSPGTIIDPLDPDHSLMNQESQAVDSSGRLHTIISYVPGRFGQCTTNYQQDRTAHGRTFHVYQDASGAWHKRELPFATGSTQRSHLVLDHHDNAYLVMPFGRIVGAPSSSEWTDWQVVYEGTELNAFGEVVVDDTRVSQHQVLSFMYQQKSSGTAPSPLRVVDFQLLG